MKKYLSVFLLIGLLLGCSSTPVKRQDFLLSSERVEIKASSAPKFGVLQVAELRANRPYNTQSLIYRESAQRFVLDPHNGFLAAPAQQISAETRDRLARSGLFSGVLPQGSTLAAQWRLEGELQTFYIDVTQPAKPAVTLEIRYALLADDSATPQLFMLSKTVPILDASPEQAVIGFNRGLNAILLQLESSLLAVKPL
ncbi:ABC-type transport auxiliary lipoprotein family protein [Deefgea rivuli]|uniref:ABC-type transport auxiliary lipoprotein family protein n=1 Tax=Deefgea rivuli TaxID=400948 RepID=UPI0004816AC3|nr:ABC-type transport auxiliary lipoprotein family protein [Deefgea rivuli]